MEIIRHRDKQRMKEFHREVCLDVGNFEMKNNPSTGSGTDPNQKSGIRNPESRIPAPSPIFAP
jgi:hypothetical protein